jgi:hypothetical protein
MRQQSQHPHLAIFAFWEHSTFPAILGYLTSTAFDSQRTKHQQVALGYSIDSFSSETPPPTAQALVQLAHVSIHSLGTGSHIVGKILLLYLRYRISTCQFHSLLGIDRRLAPDNAIDHDLDRLIVPVT